MAATFHAFLLACASILCALSERAIAVDETLARRFTDPPLESRILKIIHSWPDDPSAQDNLIRQLSRQGFGGVVCNVSFDEYLRSDAKWKAFTRAVTTARKAGWSLWLYDERGYPSGTAGGIVLREHPEWEASGLLIAESQTCGDTVSLIMPPGRPFLVGALSQHDGKIDPAGIIDLAGQVRDGRLNWQPPRGRWRVLAITLNRLYEGTHAEGNLADHIPYINLLMPGPTRRFLEVTHEPYANHLGTDLGKYFVATFTDEPSLMSLFLKPMPYRVLPWAPNLPSEFMKRRGYAIEPIVPDLVLDGGSRGEKHRYDYWLTIAELVSECYFGQIQDCCQGHHLRSGGHLLMEEGLVAHVPLYGDFLRAARRLDAPSIDCLSSLPPEAPWFIARLLASAAGLEGKTVVMSETSDHAQRFRPPGDKRPARDVTEAEIRGTLNRLFVGGVNCITSYYSFAGLSDTALQRLNTWVGRCGTMLSGGHQVADVALVYPVQSVWPRFVPSRHWTGEAHAATEVEDTYRAAMESLFNSRREFTIVDARAIDDAAIRDGALVHGALRWRVVVLPAVDTLPLAAWQKLARFARDGGVVVALGLLPANSEAQFPSPQVLALARELFGNASGVPTSLAHSSGGGGVFLPHGSEGLLPIVLDGLLEPEISVSPPAAPLRMTHRRVDGHDLFFVINDAPRPWSGEVEFSARGMAETWDPASGKVFPHSNSSRISVALDDYGATIVRFSRPPESQRARLNPGSLPNLSDSAMPRVEPAVAHGTHVRCELTSGSIAEKPHEPGIQARATLTKGGVDTYAFVRFHHEPSLELDSDDCLIIDSWVPTGQRTRTNLLLILHESGGGDFLADSGRSLASPGHARSYVPLSRFQPAGWSTDADGVLDVSRISDLSVGWGGYIGQEGERVEFTVAAPRIGTARKPAPPAAG
jgi:hypothetical protein